MQRIITSITVKPEILSKLKAISAKNNISVSRVLENLVLSYLNEEHTEKDYQKKDYK